MTSPTSLVATLIANSTLIDDATLARVRPALPVPGEAVWLDPGRAADIPFSPSADADQRALAEALRELVPGVDVVVQPSAGRRKKLFLADMDSTMIGQECIDELAAFVGLKEHVAAITERAMRGEIEFEPALRERVALLKGLPAAVVDEVIEHHITLTPGGRLAIATMRAHGAYTCLVSGGFTLFTDRIAAMIGFDEARANTLEIDGDKPAGQTLAGLVREPIFGRDSKRATLIELRDRLGLAEHETMATGDGANDIPMIEAATYGIAYRAKPKARAAADGWIDRGDLTAILELLGIPRSEWVAA